METMDYCTVPPGRRVPRWERRVEWIELCMACASVGAMRWSAMVVRRAGMVPVKVDRALVVAYRIQGAGAGGGAGGSGACVCADLPVTAKGAAPRVVVGLHGGLYRRHVRG